MRVLIVHGPNMNLIGSQKLKDHNTLTLDKINSKIRKSISSKKISIKIIQTHDENKIVSYIQKQRNKINHIIISLESWHYNGYILRDTLSIIKKPISFTLNEHKQSIFESMMNDSNTFIDSNYIDAYLESIQSLK